MSLADKEKYLLDPRPLLLVIVSVIDKWHVIMGDIHIHIR